MPVPSIPDPRLRPYLCRVAILGTSAANTRDGRLWLRLSESSGTVTASLYRHPSLQSGDLVAQASGAGPVLSLSQSNESGLTGTIELAETSVPLLAATGQLDGKLQAYIASDVDLLATEPGLAKLLDEEASYAGEPGFGWALGEAHRTIYGVLSSRVLAHGLSPAEAAASPVLLRDATVLAPAVAMLALAALLTREAARGDPLTAARARSAQTRAERAVAAATVEVIRPSGLPDLLLKLGDVVLRR